MTAAKFEIELDFQAAGYSYDRDGEPMGFRTVEEAVIEAAASQITARVLHGPEMSGLAVELRRVRDEVIREKVVEIVEAKLGQELQQTDDYGTPRGPAKPLHQIVLEQAQKVVNSRPSGSYGSKTVLEKVIADEVGRVFEAELKIAVQSAKSQLITLVQQKAAKVLGEALVDVAAERVPS